MDEQHQKNRKVYTLLDITRSLQSVIRKNYTGQYWIKAEIARLNFYPKSGHCYPDLVHKVKGKIQAEMRSIIWKSDYRRLSKQFREVVKEELKDGMNILFKATVNFHQKYGLSLNIIEIEPSFTLGEMAREKAETIHKLKADGVYDHNKKIPFPILPKRIAVISVETSKGYSDFLNVLDNNRWGFSYSHYLFPALLQGDRAIQSISRQLHQIGKVREHFDIVAIIRGGGGDVGLNSYDDYHLAKQVALFPLPVLTGIGHSTNETVVEMVAHSNKITPTDLAYFLVDAFYKLTLKIEQFSQRLSVKTHNIISAEHNRLERYQKALQTGISYYSKSQRYLLDAHLQTIGKEAKKRIDSEERQLEEFTVTMQSMIKQSIDKEHQKLAGHSRMLEIFSKQRVNESKNQLESLKSKHRLLDPQNVMKRGYSISTINGDSITTSRRLSVGDQIKTYLYEGSFESEIKSVNYGNKQQHDLPGSN